MRDNPSLVPRPRTGQHRALACDARQIAECPLDNGPCGPEATAPPDHTPAESPLPRKWVINIKTGATAGRESGPIQEEGGRVKETESAAGQEAGPGDRPQRKGQRREPAADDVRISLRAKRLAPVRWTVLFAARYLCNFKSSLTTQISDALSNRTHRHRA